MEKRVDKEEGDCPHENHRQYPLEPPGAGNPHEQATVDLQHLHERYLPRMQDKAKADEDPQDVDHEEEEPELHFPPRISVR